MYCHNHIPILINLLSVIVPIQIIWIYASYYIVCTANPGIVTPNNLKQHLKYYRYDGLIYTPKDCSTCKFQKYVMIIKVKERERKKGWRWEYRPARSKHCSLCKACVGKMDHHCAWINGCIGENNQRYFFIFLFTLVEFSAYGAYLCFQIYRGMIIEWGLDKAYMLDSNGNKVPVSFHKAFLVSYCEDDVKNNMLHSMFFNMIESLDLLVY